MNSEESLDLWSEISLPQWIGNQSDINLGENIFSRSSSKAEDKSNIIENHMQGEEQEKLEFKRNSPVKNNQNPESYEVQSSGDKVSSSNNVEQDQETQKDGSSSKEKTKLERRCQNSRKYRERKREYVKSLQEENKFLKLKIDDLNFKLSEMQREINRLKHKDPQQTQTFHTTKSKCLKQLEVILQKNVATHQELLQTQARLKKVMSFDNKQKVDYLNYFMTELLENVISDRTFYFIDCLINKRGVHRESYDQELRRIDVQVLEILNIDEIKLKESFLESRRLHLAHEASRLKELWKKLYQVYLGILHQGMKLDRVVEPMKQRLMNFVKIQNFLRVQLHFERNKYRSDIRYLRNSWFRELTEQPLTYKEKQKSLCSTKRIKCNQ